MAELTDYPVIMSYRFVGNAEKKYLEKPSWDDVLERLQQVEAKWKIYTYDC